jgi:hypothetical protein
MMTLGQGLGLVFLKQWASFFIGRYMRVRHGHSATPAVIREVLIGAGPWCGCPGTVCRRRRVPAQWPVLAGARPPLRLWVCSPGGGCRFRVAGGVAWELWFAARAEGGSVASPTMKSGDVMTLKPGGTSGQEGV